MKRTNGVRVAYGAFPLRAFQAGGAHILWNGYKACFSGVISSLAQ